MFQTRLLASLCEFALTLVLAVFVVFWSYRSFARVTRAYDVVEQLQRRNTAVAVLLTALMVATSLMMRQSVYPVIGTITIYLTGAGGLGLARTLGYCAGHLLLGFLLSVGVVELSLLLFSRLAREIDGEREIGRGNLAVAVVMAGVIFVVAFYMQQGVGGLSKTLIPQPALGRIEMLR